MTWLQLCGVVLVVWLWIVCGVSAFCILTDWFDHRRVGKVEQAAPLLRLWNRRTS